MLAKRHFGKRKPAEGIGGGFTICQTNGSMGDRDGDLYQPEMQDVDDLPVDGPMQGGVSGGQFDPLLAGPPDQPFSKVSGLVLGFLACPEEGTFH